MDTDLPVSLSPAFLKVTRVRAQACPRVAATNLPRSVTPRPSGRWATRASRPALRVGTAAGPAPTSSPPRAQRPTPGPPRSATLAPPLRAPATSLGGSRGSRGSSGSTSGLLDDAANQASSTEPSASGERAWTSSWSALRGISLAGPPAGWGSGAPRLSRHRPRSLGPEFGIPEIHRNYLDKKEVVKAPKSRQNGGLTVFDPKEKVMTDPNKEMSQKCFGHRPRPASKIYTSPLQISPGVANTFSAKKEASSKKTEDLHSFRNENRSSSRSIENKDVLNQQSNLWSSSFLKECAGEVGKDLVLAKQEKNSECCLEDIEEKLSDSTDGDGEDDTNGEDDEVPTKKETRAPLELMAEFLRAEMGRDYQLAKKLCQMILIYEPENPVAKEFFSLIEEILLKEKAQKHEEDEEDSDEEDTSSESETESSEDASSDDDSSDECEDGA